MNHLRQHYLKTLFLSIVTVFVLNGSCIQAKSSSQKPNVIIIFTDDQGYQDLGCYGSPLIKTPNLDRMAQEGIKFTDFYSASPVCSPSRAALLTGCYPPRMGIVDVLHPKSEIDGLSPDEITIAELLKEQGYATACIGKWHLGNEDQYLPTRQGFDYYYGIPYSNDMYPDPEQKLAKHAKFYHGVTAETYKTHEPKRHWLPLMQGEEIIEYPLDQTDITQRYTKQAITFIKQNQKNPFFLYLPHAMPHVPLFATKEFKGKSKGGLYGDTIEELDWSVGEVLKTLKECNIDDNTLVVFASDNGPWLEFGDEGGSALPLREGKFETYEGGMRVPCIVRWPGHIPSGQVCSEIASTIDFLPTIMGITGGKVPSDRIIDGKNILPLLKNSKTNKSPHDAFYYYREAGVLEAIREGDWKLRKAVPEDEEDAEFAVVELYNLKKDISEKNNLAKQYPNIVSRLSERMIVFDKKMKKNARPAGGATKDK